MTYFTLFPQALSSPAFAPVHIRVCGNLASLLSKPNVPLAYATETKGLRFWNVQEGQTLTKGGMGRYTIIRFAATATARQAGRSTYADRDIRTASSNFRAPERG
jgi:hypothetical protein